MSEAKPELLDTIPYVWVADVKQAIPFYRDKLGFEVEFEFYWVSEGARYGLALMNRDKITLHLRVCECGDGRHTGTSFYQVLMKGIDALHAEYEQAGAKILFPPTTQDWGVRDFQVEDPEGNRIYFFEDV